VQLALQLKLEVRPFWAFVLNSASEQLEGVCGEALTSGRGSVAGRVNAEALAQLTCALLDLEEIEKHAQHHHRDSGPHVDAEALLRGI
jgi:hypothetical protein